MKILAGVYTCDKHHERASIVKKTYYKDFINANIDTKFIVSNKDNLVDENYLSLPCEPHYEHLPQKTFFFLKYAYDKKYDYIFKCDDDTFICVDKLLEINFNYFDYVGNFFRTTDDYEIGSLVDKQGWEAFGKNKIFNEKYRQLRKEFFNGVYATGGTGYFLSRNAIKIFLDQVEKLQEFDQNFYIGEDSTLGKIFSENRSIGEDTLLGKMINTQHKMNKTFNRRKRTYKLENGLKLYDVGCFIQELEKDAFFNYSSIHPVNICQLKLFYKNRNNIKKYFKIAKLLKNK
jgi:hypothetical protein